MPITNPPMCAHHATPPPAASIGAASPTAPFSTCIKNQRPRYTVAGISITPRKMKTHGTSV